MNATPRDHEGCKAMACDASDNPPLPPCVRGWPLDHPETACDARGDEPLPSRGGV
jgi:hypothetical protein